MKHLATFGTALTVLTAQALAAEPTALEIFDAFATRYERISNIMAPLHDPGTGDSTFRDAGGLMVWPANRGKAYLFAVPDKHFCEPAAVPGQWICSLVLPFRSVVLRSDRDDPGSGQARKDMLAEGRPAEFQMQVVLIPEGDRFMSPDVFVVRHPDGFRDFHVAALGCQSIGRASPGADGMTEVEMAGCAGASRKMVSLDCEQTRGQFVQNRLSDDPANPLFWLGHGPQGYVACIEGTGLDPGIATMAFEFG